MATTGQIRSQRLQTLLITWNKSNHDPNAVIHRAMQMGVTIQTARSYLDTIRRRYP